MMPLKLGSLGHVRFANYLAGMVQGQQAEDKAKAETERVVAQLPATAVGVNEAQV